MYRNIVVGTDGSATAAVAVGHAGDLAKLTGATVHIVHAFRTVSTAYLAAATSASTWTEDLEETNASIVADANRVCADAAAELSRRDMKVETHARPGEGGRGEPAENRPFQISSRRSTCDRGRPAPRRGSHATSRVRVRPGRG